MTPTLTPDAYLAMTDVEREAAHGWIDGLGLNHRDIPIDAPMEYDETVGEWRIMRLASRNGRHYIGEDGEIAQVVVRRVSPTPPPWLAAAASA